MPRGPHLGGGRVDEYTLAVEGLGELRRALRRVDREADKALKRDLRQIGNNVRDRARANISHRTGRHGDPTLPRLASTIRVGVKARALTVFSDQPYARVQDQGGRVGRGAVIPRARASAYMTRAVQQSRSTVEQQVERLGDTIEREFGR